MNKNYNLHKILEDIRCADKNTDLTDLPVNGKSPFGDSWPTGIWAWDESTQEVIVGQCQDDFEIISYKQAHEIYNR